MSTNTAKRIISAITAAVMMLSFIPSVSAASVVSKESEATVIDAETQPDEWSKYVTMFSQQANSLKKDTPYCVVTNESGLAEKDGITVESSSGGYEEVDDGIKKWIVPIFDGMFKSNSSVTKSFIEVLLGEGILDFDSMTFYKGENRDNYIPLYGQSSVSLLTPDDKDFDLTVAYSRENPNTILGIQVLYGVSESAAEVNSSRNKVFSISDGTIAPVIISGSGDPVNLDVKFSNFKYGRSKAELYFNEDGTLSKYLSEVPYEFSASLYDLLQILDAVYKNEGFTFSFVDSGFALANTILTGLNKPTVTAEDILNDYKLEIKYIVRTVIDNLNYNDRLFGDIDRDTAVTVTDARTALRHAVQLEVIKETDELIYGDVDFDGDIDVTDARLILRMAVQLDPTFSEVPAGKKIKIVNTERPDSEDTENSDNTDGGNTTDTTDKTDDTVSPDKTDKTDSTDKKDYSDLEKIPASVAQAVFNLIEQIGGTSDSFVEYIKQIIAAAKG